MAKSMVDQQAIEPAAQEETKIAKVPQLSTGNLVPSTQMSEEDEYKLMMQSEEMLQIRDALHENINDRAEIRAQRLAIMQAKSPEVDKSVPGYKQGQIVNNVTREILTIYAKPQWLIDKGVPENEISQMFHQMMFIPIAKLPTEYVHWKKKEERKEGEPNIWFKTLDESDHRVKAGVWKERGGTWGTTPETKGKAPPVTSNINWLILPVDMKTWQISAAPIVCSFNRTSENAGKLLTKFVKDHGLEGLPPFGRAYYLYTTQEQFGKETAQVLHVAHGKKVWENNKDLVKLCFEIAKHLSDKVEGRTRQEEMLNMADLDSDGDAVEAHVAGDGSIPNSNPVAPGESDPFDDSTPVNEFPE